MTLNELIKRLEELRDEMGVNGEADIYVNDSFGGITISEAASRYTRQVYDDNDKIVNEYTDVIIY